MCPRPRSRLGDRSRKEPAWPVRDASITRRHLRHRLSVERPRVLPPSTVTQAAASSSPPGAVGNRPCTAHAIAPMRINTKLRMAADPQISVMPCSPAPPRTALASVAPSGPVLIRPGRGTAPASTGPRSATTPSPSSCAAIPRRSRSPPRTARPPRVAPHTSPSRRLRTFRLPVAPTRANVDGRRLLAAATTRRNRVHDPARNRLDRHPR